MEVNVDANDVLEVVSQQRNEAMHNVAVLTAALKKAQAERDELQSQIES